MTSFLKRITTLFCIAPQFEDIRHAELGSASKKYKDADIHQHDE
jgi:hypothetical protein